MMGLILLNIFFIIPIYFITINKYLIEKSIKSTYICSILYNPAIVYILTPFIGKFLKQILHIPYFNGFEIVCFVLTSILFLIGFIHIFDIKKEHIGIDCVVCLSFILIQYTCLYTIYIESIKGTIITCVILPIFAYIGYYFVISIKIPTIIKAIDNKTTLRLNLVPCLTSLIILLISFINDEYIQTLNFNNNLSFIIILINYSILLLEYIVYYILFMNIEKTYKLKLATNQIISNQEQVIKAFANVIENANETTGDHVKRVSEYSKIIAMSLGYSKEDAEQLRIASMLHDIGKIYIPNNILDKNEKLTIEEFAIIKSHVTKGEELLHNVEGDLMDLAKQITLHHHEKYNGTGYLGVKGEDIYLPARIVAVADVFDALVSKRSYKECWKVEDAYNLINDNSGTHFDPKIVKAFNNSYDKIVEIYEQYKIK